MYPVLAFELPLYGVEIEKRLRRMLAHVAVACIDDVYLRDDCGARCGTCLGMAHHDDVGVIVDDLYRILKSLALRLRRGVAAFHCNDFAAEAEHCGFETKTRACRGLKKKRGKYLAFNGFFPLTFKRGRELEKFSEGFSVELLGLDEVIELH